MAQNREMPGIVIRGNGERWHDVSKHEVWNNGQDHRPLLRFVGGLSRCVCGVTGCTQGNKAH